VEGRSITTLSRRAHSDVRKRMGFLFQNAALFDSMTVGENVAFPLRRHTDLDDSDIEEKVRAKLAAVGLERDIRKMPSELSGGMRKRVGLARAMALDPAILLVDEPSAGLDPITTREIDELLLREKHAGTTLVVVTHNIPSARFVGDELAFLHEGRILARGTAEELDQNDDPLVRAFMHSEGGG
jgi:phospholipid/cholesterol/gamma-HCH transport system ATP-binding protein